MAKSILYLVTNHSTVKILRQTHKPAFLKDQITYIYILLGLGVGGSDSDDELSVPAS